MFYSQFILAKKGPLGTIWIAAHLERKLRKNQVADTDIGVSVDSILFPDVPIALRLSSHLLLGVVRIYSRKVNYLFDDCSEALLKIKQAFRSTAVDLPPEESTAPYHSITLPETFDLDDFELPDNDIFQGTYIDHHVSTKEQITLQDTMDGVVYSTSQFGLDERFGDGDTSQIGLDLDEDLFLSKVAAPENAGIHLDPGADPQASSQPRVSVMDEDNEELDEPLQTTATKVDGDQAEEQPARTEPADYAHAPSTPGLLEEPNLLNVQKALASDDHLESEDHNSAELEVTKNAGNFTSHAGHSGDKGVLDPPLLHSSDADTILAEENGHHKGELVNENRETHENGTAKDMVQVASDRISELLEDSGSMKNLDNGVLNENRQILEQEGKETGLDEPVASSNISHGVEESSHRSHSAEQLPEILCTDSINESLSKGLQENGVCTDIVTSDHVEENFHDPNEDKILDPAEQTPLTGMAVLKACRHQHDKPSLDNGDMLNVSDLKSSRLCSTDLSGREDKLHASGEIQGSLPDDVHSVTTMKQLSSNSEKENELDHVQLDQVGKVVSKDQLESTSPSTSELPAPEKLLSMHEDASDIQKGLLLDSTPAKDIQAENESDGASGNVITGKKRSFTESTLTLESLNSDVSFAKGPSMRTVDSIPDDDDLLSSILVGRKSSFLKLKPTPPPAEAAPAKRARTASRASLSKRKVPVDDMMVLHGDAIREQLTSTEDIRRVRKKAPCTPHEVWMMHKQFLDEEFFNDPISSGLSVELIYLYNQPLDLSGISISKVDERIACPQSAQHVEPSERSNVCTEGHKDGKDEILILAKEGEEQSVEMESGKHAEAPGVDSLSPTLDIESTREFSSGPIDGLQINAAFSSPNHMCDTVDDSSKLENNGPSVDAGDLTVGDNQNSVIDSDSTLIDEPMLEQKIDGSIDKEAGLYTDSSAPTDNSGPSTSLLAEPGDLAPELDLPLDHLSAEPELDSSCYSFAQAKADVDMNDIALNVEQSGLLNDPEEPFVLRTTKGQGISDRETADLDHPVFDNINDVEHMISGEHDTGFLNDDDDIDEEDDNSAPSTDAPNILENTGWSSRTRAVAKYLQILFDKEDEHRKRVVPVDNLLSGKTRKEASRMFFETLVLKTRDYIHVEQSHPFDNICIKPQSRLMKSNF